jgi:hypothetical protein
MLIRDIFVCEIAASHSASSALLGSLWGFVSQFDFASQEVTQLTSRADIGILMSVTIEQRIKLFWETNTVTTRNLSP